MIDYDKYALSLSESRKWGFIAGACGLLVYFGFYFIGYKEKALFAGAAAVAMVSVCRLRKDIFSNAWFWIFVTIFTLIHVYLIFIIPFGEFHSPGILLVPFVLIDIVIMFHLSFLLKG
jgi:hypothetical protein